MRLKSRTSATRKGATTTGLSKRSVCATVSFLVFFAVWITSPTRTITTTTTTTTTTTNVLEKSSSNNRIFHNSDELPDSVLLQLDAILILGGGSSKSIEDPPPFTKERCDAAARVVKRQRQAAVRVASNQKPWLLFFRGQTKDRGKQGNEENVVDLPILTLSAGSAHVPQLMSQEGLPVWESTSSAAYLQKQYNLSTNLHVETTSYDTIGNAFYARTTHTDINGWRRLLIITSEFHMARTKAIFDWIFLSLQKEEVEETTIPYHLYYLASPDTGLTEDARLARIEREQQSLQTIYKLAQQFRTLKDVYHFMTHHHDLYTASKLVERAKYNSNRLNDLVRKSYGVTR